MKIVDNPTQYLLSNLNKISNFDHKWTSLVTNNPLLLEDLEYAKILPYIDNHVTDYEIEQYKLGQISNLYTNIEGLLISNLHKYDRIISLCTMLFNGYVTVDDERINNKLEHITGFLSITPTRLMCMALTSARSTKTELEYAWGLTLDDVPDDNVDSDKTALEYNWHILYNRSDNFKLFMQYCALRCGTNGFRATWIADKTSNKKLATVCSKFTKKSNAVDDSQLSSLFAYHQHTKNDNNKLLKALRSAMDVMFNNENQNYAIYCYADEFYLHSIKFSMKVSIKDGKIVKEYLANSYECFIAEKFLVKSMNAQINWVKREFPEELTQQKNILQNLLFDLLSNNYRDIVCIKNMYDGVISRITFTGIFANVKIIEDLIVDNRVIKTNTFCFSKLNASKYIINRGYYIFGYSADIDTLLNNIENHELQTITNKMFVDHYKNYCKPIINHMFDVIQMYNNMRNDIIDVLCFDKINPDKINNINIAETMLKTDNVNPLNNITKKSLRNKKSKSYWRAIQD